MDLDEIKQDKLHEAWHLDSLQKSTALELAEIIKKLYGETKLGNIEWRDVSPEQETIVRPCVGEIRVFEAEYNKHDFIFNERSDEKGVFRFESFAIVNRENNEELVIGKAEPILNETCLYEMIRSSSSWRNASHCYKYVSLRELIVLLSEIIQEVLENHGRNIDLFKRTMALRLKIAGKGDGENVLS